MSYNKNKDFDEDLKNPTQGFVSDGSRIRQANKAETKFRTKFDPRVTARYDIKALIGRGSFSHVVRVEHRHTRQPFAIKLLEVKGHEGRESCRAELQVLRRVRHANIIRLAEVFETSHRVYLVLELATGGELLERVVARGSFTETDATRALIMVSSGLRYIHTLGIIHRDLKPENLLYYHPGQDSRLIITDFGLACWDSKSRTVERGDMTVGGSCGAGSGREIVNCARSVVDDDDDRGTGGTKSCSIIHIKDKGTLDDCRRLVDGGKARESSQGRGIAIGGDKRGNANGCPVSTGDEREIDERLGFDGTGKDSSGVENKGGSCTALSGGTKRDQLEESQTDVLEMSKHTNPNMEGERENRLGQERQSQFSHDKLKARRQTNCIECRQDGDHNNREKGFQSFTIASLTKDSGCRNGRDWALRTLCGTPEYLAPEMVGGRPYGSAVDMWALGVISYILLSGSMPFDQRSRPRLFKAILWGSYSFHGEPWSSVSNQAKDFIERLLSLNPEQRMTAEQALKHPWLVTKAAGLSKRNLHRPISQNLRQRASRFSTRSSSSSGSAQGSRCAASPRSHTGHESCQLGGNRLQHSVMVSA
ncbi:hypothetical protein SRHO_G00157160 [Serrasalmus rhombeus]